MNYKMVNNPIKMGKRLDNPQKKICMWANRYMKRYSISLVIRKCKLKPQ